MNKNAKTTCTNQFQDELAKLAQTKDSERTTLPPYFYCSEQVFELEKEKVFKAGWICIGRTDQIPIPGDYFALDVVGEPVLMIRGSDHQISVFSNVCKHRWMQICSGTGNATTLVCPYHAWTYNLDGSLRSAPLANNSPGINAKNVHLTTIRHEIWQGFVYINLDGNAPALAPRLVKPAEVFQKYGVENWRVARTIELPEYPWDWKVMQDNGECYHHIGAHRETFEDNYPTRDVSTQCGDAYTFQRSAASSDALQPGDDGELYCPTYFTPVSGLDAEFRTCFVLLNVFPNFFIYLQPDYGMNMRMLPVASGRIKLFADIIVPPHAFDLDDFDERLERAEAFFHKFNDEDVYINTRIQMGLQSQFSEPGLLTSYENHNLHFAKWVVKKLTTG